MTHGPVSSALSTSFSSPDRDLGRDPDVGVHEALQQVRGLGVAVCVVTHGSRSAVHVHGARTGMEHRHVCGRCVGGM